MSNYPTVRPSLTLDFQKSKQLDPRITFSRTQATGKASYVQGGVIKYADEHQARFEDKGLLIEESRANTIVNSTNMPAIFTATELTATANAGTAPDGTNTAVKLEASANATQHFYQCASGGGATRTYTVFAKANGENTIYLGNYFYVSQGFNFNLTDDSEPSGSISGSITYSYTQKNLANGWKRLSYTVDSYGGRFNFIVMPGGNNSNAGTGGAVLIWGPMSENAAFPTSYIPTAGSTVTRSADVVQITGDNFSSWYNQSEGTVLLKATTLTTDPKTFFYICDASSAASDRISHDTNSLKINSGGTAIINRTISAYYPYNSAIAYKANNFATSERGVVQTVSSGAVPSNVDIAYFYHPVYSQVHPSCHISRLSYYTRRLTDSELQTITS
jgi:hypothetical protein